MLECRDGIPQFLDLTSTLSIGNLISSIYHWSGIECKTLNLGVTTHYLLVIGELSVYCGLIFIVWSSEGKSCEMEFHLENGEIPEDITCYRSVVFPTDWSTWNFRVFWTIPSNNPLTYVWNIDRKFKFEQICDSPCPEWHQTIYFTELAFVNPEFEFAKCVF